MDDDGGLQYWAELEQKEYEAWLDSLDMPAVWHTKRFMGKPAPLMLVLNRRMKWDLSQKTVAMVATSNVYRQASISGAATA